MPLKLPLKYASLASEGAPQLLVKALELYGTVEIVGKVNSPAILSWLQELRFSWIKDDETPWCGTALAIAAVRAGVAERNPEMPRAFWWCDWGTLVPLPTSDRDPNGPSLGDVLVFTFSHVGIYVGEDATHYHVLGGNQANRHGIDRFAKSALKCARRTKWKIGQPANVRRIWRDGKGVASGVGTR